MATFRDLATEADGHLTAATKRIGTLPQAEAALIAHELTALARTCGRILDDALDARLDRLDDGGTWVSAAQQARVHVRSLEEQLGEAATAYMIDQPLAARIRGPIGPLRQAARSLGLAEEFLQTHLTAAPPGARSPKVRVSDGLSNPLTARELVALTGRWIGLIGQASKLVAGTVQVPRQSFRVDTKPITRLLRQAAVCAANAHTIITSRTGAPRRIGDRVAIAPNTGPAVSAPAPDTGATIRLLGTVAQDAHRLRTTYQSISGNRSPRRSNSSAQTMRYVATSAGSAYANAAIITQQLAARAAELHGTRDTPMRPVLAYAADALIDASQAWHATAHRWDRFATRATGMGAATERATGIVLRLGRVAFTDPDWTPASRSASVRSAADLAPDMETLNIAANHLHRLVSEFTGAARAGVTAVNDLQNNGTLHVHFDDGRKVAASHEHAAALRGAYADVALCSTTALHHLHDAVTGPGRDPVDAPALAAVDFPGQPAARTATTAGPQPPVPNAAVRDTVLHRSVRRA